MGIIDNIFKSFKDTVILKEDSNLEKQVEELKQLQKSNHSLSLAKDIKLLELGIKGENAIAYELKCANLGLYVLRDITIFYEDLKAQIDYVVVSKGFTYLIECKNLVGNIYVNNKGEFQREYEYAGKKIKEAIYSPYTQAMRHKEILKKRWLAKNSSLAVAFNEKKFDNLWYKPLVVLANSKSILDIKHAPIEIRKNTIRIDQLVEYIKNDLSNYDKDLLSNSNDMLKIANKFLEINTNDYCSLASKYNQTISNDEELLNKLKSFRKEKSKEMNVPAYYIFNDEELNKIIALKPMNIESLKEILPSIKVKVHGANIIKIVNESK